MLELTTGNLLDADVEALVNTVNTEGIMGKGVALQFKKRFPEMFLAYQKACKAGQVRPGEMHVFEREDMLNPRFIINFPTKRHWRSPAKIEDIDAGLKALKAEVRKRHIKSLALPPLGCGNGGLDWAVVYPRIQKALGDLSNVRVLVFPPANAPEVSKMVHKTDRPKMTPSRAIAVKIWSQYFVLGYQLTLLEVHKLLYFLQEAGEPLQLRFEKSKYGPYADNLRHLLHRFEGHFTIGFGDGRNKPDTLIELREGALQEADDYLQQHSAESESSLKRLARVQALIEGFESPYGMELLASVHWIGTRENRTSLIEAKKAVRQWNPRKARLMKPEHVELAWKRLNDKGWFE